MFTKDRALKLKNLQTLRDPGALDVFKVVEIDAAQCLHPQIFRRAHGRRTELSVFRLKRPRDERGEISQLGISAFRFPL